MKNSRRQAIKTQTALFTLMLSSAGPRTFGIPQDADSAKASGLDPERLQNTLVHVKLGSKTVCGFIAELDGKQYALTNTQHISGYSRFTLTTLAGQELRPTKIELSTTRDIARILIDSGQGLALSPAAEDDTPVVLPDFANGNSTAKEIDGVVKLASEERFDISAAFGREQCGSPILTADAEVCGIACYIDYYKIIDKQWASTTLHFASRIEGTDWFSPNWRKYDELYGKPLQEADAFRERIYRLANDWMDNLKAKIETDEDVSLDIQRWIRQHNSMVTNLGNKRGKKKGGGDPYASFRKDFSDSCSALIDICSAKAKTIAFLAEQKNTTPFLKNQFLRRSRELQLFVKFIRAFEELNANYRW
jgi:hypothetical protein